MRRRLFPFLAGLVSLVAAIGGSIPAPAGAQPAESIGIRLVDAPTDRANDPRAHVYVVDHVSPGTTIKRRIEISNSTGKQQVVQLYPAAATIADGAFQFGEGRAANDLTTWTALDPPTLTLAAEAKGVSTVTIAVPAKATAGEQYGVVWAEVTALAPAGGGISAVNRVGVRMYLSVGPGGEPATDFEVAALQGRRAADGSPVVAATVHNTGGRAIDLSGELRLAGGPGGLSAGPFAATLGTSLGLGQTEPVLVTLDNALPSGPWDARIVLRSGTTEREVSARITFPDQAAGTSAPVEISSSSGSGPIVAGGIVLLVLLAGLGVLLLIGRRRKREPEPQATPPRPAEVPEPA
jgi:hypothetical protein